ncbi:MAG: nicotinate-nucleotide adenylyltransferase [Bacteroidales bacterium]|nr:nicotinate-nucleotide adenylyltransferase [Bacteroidales bacterium]MCM1414466.1 nicotinate-nucleotide adenylyltransferase [bacterium]MCM1422353.1 nicotinate-nucleotide adenylyltransferase [bacterium]
MKRIGILGGTFDPIHNGHLMIAGRAREQFLLEKVLFLPSGVPYMKDRQEISPVEIRCEMTALAIADTPAFALSKLEVEDAARGKNTYTYETLQKLRKIDSDADYFFILGADNLFAIESWKNPALIFENCTLLAAVRNDEEKSLERQTAYLREKYHARIEILEFTGMDISSTQIRERLRRGESVSGLMPVAVETYIRQNRLYQTDSQILS